MGCFSAINASQVQVTFNSDIDPASVLTDVKVATGLKTGLIATVTPVGSSTANVFKSAAVNGKTVTLTYTTPLTGRNVVVLDAFKTTAGNVVAKYDEVLTFTADKVAPTIVSNEKVSASQYKVTFSEPISNLGTVSYKLADGTVIANGGTGVTSTFTTGNSYATFSMGSDVAVNKTVTATFIGTQDQASNLINPNPATASFTKGDKDGIAPTVVSATQASANTVAVKFSEEIISAPTAITVGVTSSASVAKDSTDPTKYIYTFSSALTAGNYFAVVSNAYSDLSGETGTAYNKAITITQDAVAPKVVSNKLITDATTGKQLLELTFDKEVALASATATATGTYVKDYVTSNSTTFIAANLTPSATDKKVVTVKVSDLVKSAAGTDDITSATYNLSLALANVTSLSGTPATTPATVSFVRAADGAIPVETVLVFTGATQGIANNNQVVVAFDIAVDPASATVASNYVIAGATVESATYNASVGTNKVTLNLVANSSTFTGTRNITVSNVKAAGSSVTMVATSKTVALNENIVPTYTTELVTANVVKVVFSEPVANKAVSPSSISGLKGLFGVTYNGTDTSTYTVSDVYTTQAGATAATAGDVVAADTAYTTVYLKLSAPLADIAKSVDVKLAGGLVDATVNGAITGTNPIVGNALVLH